VVDSIVRASASATLNWSFAMPWLLKYRASGGPEIVVIEYSTPTPSPNGAPTARVRRIGQRSPAAWTRISGSSAQYVTSFAQSALIDASTTLPIATPGRIPIAIGATWRHTARAPARARNRTQRLTATSTITSAGLSSRPAIMSSAIGTVIEE
jgi:hypothetical protein